MTPTTLLRPVLVAAAAFLAACAPFDPENLPPLGDFRLGHNVVLAQEVAKGPFSRDVSKAELTTALADAVEKRLIGYDGDGLYHLGISIGGYVLALPGVPVVYTPKSVMIFEVTVFDNDTGERLNEKPFRITAFEGLENSSIVGSGLIRSKNEQLSNLANDGARQLHQWLIENAAWFTPDPDQARTEYNREEWKTKLAEAVDGQDAITPATVPSTTDGTAAPGAPPTSGGTVSTLTLPEVAN